MNRLSRENFLTQITFPLVLLVVAGFAWRPLAGGDDFWAHAAIGRWIIEHHQIPRHTLFLWTAHIPWIAHAWGTGVLFFGLMRLGGEHWGPFLVQILNELLCLAPFFLLWRFWRKQAPYSSLVPPMFVLGIWVSAARFHPRPELFTALFLAILMLFLIEWPKKKDTPKAPVFAIVLMFAIWPNMHGAVVIGLIILWATAFCELAQSRGDFRLLVLALLCTVTIFVFNPRGLEYYKVLIPVASKTFQKIDEWKPFWAWPKLAPELVIGEFLLWGFGMLLWSTNPHRRWAQLGWMLLMGAAFLKARRQLWLTSLTSLAVMVSNARGLDSDELFRGWRRLTKGDIHEPIPDPMRLIMRGGVIVILICAIAQSIPKTFWPVRAVDRKLPVGMAQFLLTKAPKGRIFNDYEYSAYLEWALHEKRTLYIDLNNAYPDSLMDEYMNAIAYSKKPVKTALLDRKRAQILADRDVEIVALRPYKPEGKMKVVNASTGKVSMQPKPVEGLTITAKYLDKSPDWKRIYSAEDGTVWARS